MYALFRMSARLQIILTIFACMVLSCSFITGCGDDVTTGEEIVVVPLDASKVPVVRVPQNLDTLVVLDWLVAGAFNSPPILNAVLDGAMREGYDTDFLTAIGGETAPQIQPGTSVVTPDDGRTITFTPYRWLEDYIDLTKLPFGGMTYVTVYLYAVVESPEEQDVFLHIGANDCVKAWFNNELVLANPIDGGAQRSEDVVTSRLRQGRNTILLKIGQAGANWGAYMEICSLAGHQRRTVELFPKTFDIRFDSSNERIAAGDTVHMDINNWPNWPEPLPDVSWVLEDQGNDIRLQATREEASYIVPDGAPRPVTLRVSAQHPDGDRVLTESVFTVCGEDDSDYYPPTRRPDHVVISLGAAESERGVAWRTSLNVTESVVEYQPMTSEDLSGVSWAGASVRRVRGTSRRLADTGRPYTGHEARMTGLQPGQRYAYRVGTGDRRGWSEAFWFTTPDTRTDSVRVAVIGETKNSTAWSQIATVLEDLRPDVIVHTGDLVTDARYMDDMNRWFHTARRILPSIPFMPVHGRNERGSDNYFAAFTLPANAPAQNLNERCYSTSLGPIRLVALDTEFRKREQTALLDQVLGGSPEGWKIVAYCRPAYAGVETSEDYYATDYLGHIVRGDGHRDVRSAWCSVFDRLGVDLALQGYDHYYFRTKAIRGGQPVPDGHGTVYITTGGSGGHEPAQNAWFAAGADKAHFVLLTAGGTSLDVKSFDLTGEVLDHYVLSR